MAKRTVPPAPVIEGNLALIELNAGYSSLIEVADLALVMPHIWCVERRGNYASTSIGSGRVMQMHRLIMGFPPGLQVDHINCDGLDNRRSNLRIVTQSQNNMNARLRKDNTSGFKGVYFYKPNQKWKAQIQVGKNRHIGYFDTPEEAARAYDAEARKHFGEFARPNFAE